MFGEPAKVLSGCGEQHLVSDAVQASQPEPVELPNALYVRKPRLDLLALAAGPLECFGVGQSANMVAHVFADIA